MSKSNYFRRLSTAIDTDDIKTISQFLDRESLFYVDYFNNIKKKSLLNLNRIRFEEHKRNKPINYNVANKLKGLADEVWNLHDPPFKQCYENCYPEIKNHCVNIEPYKVIPATYTKKPRNKI